MRNLQTLAMIVIAAAAVTACGKPKQGGAPPPPAVTVATPITRQVTDWDDFTGRFESPQQVQVRARAGGYLQAVHFKDGQFVKKGQLLFTLDPRPAEAQLAAVRAQSEVARTDLKRAEALLAATAISREEYETRRSASLVADAALRARQLDVEFTRVTAPISGLVSDRRVDPGNVISGGTSAGDVLTTIVSVDPVYFSFDASEAQFLKYQRQGQHRGGAAVQVRLQDETTPRWSGQIDFLDNAVDAASGSVRLRALIRNSGNVIRPGMFGAARMASSGSYQALMIPESAIVSDGPRKIVYVIPASGDVTVKVLDLGPTTGGLRVVRGGLRPDDRVVINGGGRIRPGMKVKASVGQIAPPTATPTPDRPDLPVAQTATSAR
jgi:RND family efflux transporter MFP subunit